MSNDIAIHVDRVSKRFKLYHDPVTGPVKELLLFWQGEKYYQEFMALSDVSLTITRGEVVGIIGPNGAGKTTLLKLIAGLLPLDRGLITVNGKVTALLALGVGVHPEFTGRENILYGGMLLGMPKRMVLEKMEGIVEFAELGQFIDHPFRTYSAGMRARLLFAISMSIEPEILIVDEALATGDMYFVHKCQQRIEELCRSGATILFVSHNVRQIESLCSRCVVLDQGRLCFDGNVEEATLQYVKAVHAARSRMLGQELDAEDATRDFLGTGEIRISDMYFSAAGERTDTPVIGEPCQLHLEYEAREDLPSVKLCMELHSEKTNTTFAFIQTTPQGLTGEEPLTTFAVQKGKGRITVSFARLLVGDGAYHCDVELYCGAPDFQFSYEACYCHYKRRLRFQAVYGHRHFFGRGTVTEMPFDSITVEHRAP
jgi:ABC-type polysaccharide/polyol phosphate transport system ATPase subunit